MKTIWIVAGNTGEYEDHREWFLCAYPNKKKAEDRVVILNGLLGKCNRLNHDKYIDTFKPFRPSIELREETLKVIQNNKRGDKACQIDYNGAYYFTFPLELKE